MRFCLLLRSTSTSSILSSSRVIYLRTTPRVFCRLTCSRLGRRGWDTTRSTARTIFARACFSLCFFGFVLSCLCRTRRLLVRTSMTGKYVRHCTTVFSHSSFAFGKPSSVRLLSSASKSSCRLFRILT